ncbi:hypothetical protein PGT21_018440 [Puccinia graminis f. sp. tritici]|uniref:Uncharacterized protein n=1 Tax=Puccinia graminis f. sp. tritici TaxID=56615 RepID=A0A5B0MJA7_PUCGR|nr:hypothetical protein PGT21_018440 [Puccinia graminis f. sp. tritici]KAA1126939.1 hypothetical protein PGTUg99_032962 [Puccinia graminis f. sp. tritici]
MASSRVPPPRVLVALLMIRNQSHHSGSILRILSQPPAQFRPRGDSRSSSAYIVTLHDEVDEMIRE